MPIPHSNLDVGKAGQINASSVPFLQDFYLADTTLRNVYDFRAEFGNPLNTFTSGSIHTDEVNTVPSYVCNIRALLEKLTREGLWTE